MNCSFVGLWVSVGFWMSQVFLVIVAIIIIETKVHGPLFIDLWIDFMSFIAKMINHTFNASDGSSMRYKMGLWTFQVCSSRQFISVKIILTLKFNTVSNLENKNRFDNWNADQSDCTNQRDTHASDDMCRIQTTISNVYE